MKQFLNERRLWLVPRQKVAKVEKVEKIKTSSAFRGKPQTMEELLAVTGYQFKAPKRGETVSGVITGVGSRSVSVDIGAKSEAVLGERDLEYARDFIKTLKIGDELSFQVISPESDSGQILLSLKKTALTLGWQKLSAAKEASEGLEVLVSQAGRNGLLVEVFGLHGFIPLSQIGSAALAKINELVGKKIKVKVIEIDQTQEKLIFSEKACSEKEKIAQTQTALQKAKVGEQYEGVVTGLTLFGAFVQIKINKTEVEGLVHISEISWEKVEDPNSVLKMGDRVKVTVIDIDQEAGRLALSMKQLTSDPWQDLVAKYPLETQIKGKVDKLTAYGAFVEIEPGLTGLLHISKIPTQIKIDVGDEVSCFVEAIEPEKRRLQLGLALREKPIGYK